MLKKGFLNYLLIRDLRVFETLEYMSIYQHLKRKLIILQRSYEKQMLSMEANTKNELKKMEKTFDTKLAANDLEVKKHEKLGMEKVRWVMEFLISKI